MVGFDWARWHGKRDRFFNDRDRDRAVSATNGAVHLEGDKPVDLGVDAERGSLWDVFVESCVHSDGDLFTPAQGAVVAPVLIRRRAPRGQSQGPLRARHTVDGAGEFDVRRGSVARQRGDGQQGNSTHSDEKDAVLEDGCVVGEVPDSSPPGGLSRQDLSPSHAVAATRNVSVAVSFPPSIEYVSHDRVYNVLMIIKTTNYGMRLCPHS